MFNTVLGRKETFFAHKKFQSFKVPKIAFFQRGLTHAVFRQTKTRNNVQ